MGRSGQEGAMSWNTFSNLSLIYGSHKIPNFTTPAQNIGTRVIPEGILFLANFVKCLYHLWRYPAIITTVTATSWDGNPGPTPDGLQCVVQEIYKLDRQGRVSYPTWVTIREMHEPFLFKRQTIRRTIAKKCKQVGVIECWGALHTTHGALRCDVTRSRSRQLR